MRLIEFRVPSEHAGQTTDTAEFVDPKHVVRATALRDEPPAVQLTLSTGDKVDVAGTTEEVIKALGGSTKLAKVAPPAPSADGLDLDGVKDEHQRVRDGARERTAQGALEEDRPDDAGEGRERRTFATDRDPVEEEGERRKAEREAADKLKAEREKTQKAEAERQAKEAQKAANKR